jgi:hypothetical protein
MKKMNIIKIEKIELNDLIKDIYFHFFKTKNISYVNKRTNYSAKLKENYILNLEKW